MGHSVLDGLSPGCLESPQRVGSGEWKVGLGQGGGHLSRAELAQGRGGAWGEQGPPVHLWVAFSKPREDSEGIPECPLLFSSAPSPHFWQEPDPFVALEPSRPPRGG